jgi:iron complex transport system substrate-binding protein
MLRERRWAARLGMTSLALLALVPVACGDDSDGGGSGSGEGASAGDAGGSGDAWPVTVEHRHGETTIEERPETIVSLDVQWTDALLAMDVEPAGYLVNQSQGEEGPYPWQEDRLEGVEVIEMTDSIPRERILALDPDLILVTWLAEDEETYQMLAGIAPTIGLLGERQVDPWQDMVEVAGRILGEPEQAQQVVEDTEAAVSGLVADLPGLEGKTFLMANYIAGDGIYVVADPEDGSTAVLESLGMELSPDMVAQADGATGRVQLSFDNVDQLQSDFMVVLANGGDPAELPGWSELPAVASGAVAEMELTDVVGLNTPTPLSVPYVLDLVHPALEAAAA